jgi:ribonuclease E
MPTDAPQPDYPQTDYAPEPRVSYQVPIEHVERDVVEHVATAAPEPPREDAIRVRETVRPSEAEPISISSVRAEPPRQQEVRAPEPEPEPEPEIDDPNRPRRKGWWQRKIFG